jgi:peptide/nickel transport system substrate-binding protein
MSRRLFALFVVVVLGAVLAQEEAQEKPIWGWSTVAEYESATGNTIASFQQAPSLQEMVDAGTLPALEERLPTEPVVDNPFEEVGKYGGTLTLGQVSNTVAYPASNFTTFEPLFSLGRDGATIVPNIAKAWEFSEDNKTFTISLREGMKWSDGAPFTADDILFYWNDILLNEELTPNVPQKYQPGGTPMTVTKVDDYTVSFEFAVPYSAILPNLAGIVFTGCQGDAFEASHYLKQFHKTYNPDVDAQAQEAGFDSWVQYFDSKRYYWYRVTPDVPTVGAWYVSEVTPEGTVMERNPYYFKVDTAGNQLPYIDKVVATNFNDTANLAVKMVAGQYDYQDWSTSVNDYPAFSEGAEAGNYYTWLAPSLWTSIAAYSVNQNYVGDEAVATILQDVRFRQALSLAMNREEINDIIALGQGQPFQATIYPTSSAYKEAWGNHFIEYNAEQANALLDEMGMSERDSEGYRLRPDGEQFTLIISNVPDAVPAKMAELLRGYWEAIGIRTTIKDTDRTLMGQQFSSGEFMIAGWAMDGAAEMAIKIGANAYLAGWQWAPQWNAWYNSNGAEGEEPPANVKRMFELYKGLPFMAEAEQTEALSEMFDIWQEGLWRIGTIGMVPKPAITRNGLGNVDENTFTDNADVGIGFFNRMYQFYWQE